MGPCAPCLSEPTRSLFTPPHRRVDVSFVAPCSSAEVDWSSLSLHRFQMDGWLGTRMGGAPPRAAGCEERAYVSATMR